MMKPKRYQYKTTLFSLDRGGVYAGFPFSVKEEYGTNGPIRVKSWIDGFYREGSLMPIGNGEHAIYVRKEIQEAIGKKEGQEVEIVLEKNNEPRTLEIPEDFQWLLDDDHELKQKFEKLSFYNKCAIVHHINEAKRDETRVRRIENMIERIKFGFRSGQKME